jgi:hypothetical protein
LSHYSSNHFISLLKIELFGKSASQKRLPFYMANTARAQFVAEKILRVLTKEEGQRNSQSGDGSFQVRANFSNSLAGHQSAAGFF